MYVKLLLSLLLGVLFSIIMLLKFPRERKLRRIFVWAYIARVLLMLLDLMQIIPIPGSGADSEMFHSIAVYNQNVPIDNWDFVTNYSIFLTIVYSLTDCSRWFAQYLNVLMGMGMLLYLNKTLGVLSVNNKTRLQIMKIAAFMPNVIIFSAILLREAWVEMFIMMSLYYFVLWFLHQGKSYSIILSLLCVLMASLMHAGSIAVVFGYLACILLYDRKTMHIKLSKSSYAALPVIMFFVIFLFAFSETFLEKFVNFDGAEAEDIAVDIYSSTVADDAGSAYLTWLTVSTPLQGVLFAPLKMFYFLYSPIPLDWRGLMDIIAFLFDSTVYIFLSYIILKTKIPVRNDRYLIRFVLIGFLMATLVFAFGTIASGTAIRHRAKILSLLLVCYGVAMKYNSGKVVTRNV